MEKIFSLPWQMKEMESLELTLAKRARNGDSDAFAELYKIHKVYLYKIAYSYVKDEHKALDILQDCAYKGFLNVHKLRDPNIFKTWITRILINIAIDFVKNDNKVIYLDNDNLGVYNEKNVDIEEKLDLYKAINSLRENYKTVIILKYFNNMSIDEIKVVMDIPANTVKSHLRRAKETLNQILKEDYLND
ncbi:MAG: sigma-70 family RNA polymerase sigma factor [Clostridium sp.]|uniref:sigma-70 family RNA polymerase sigma factor n=1 Tax=Clostridium sp. TaxID=1506 RepID=UPI003065FBEF